ncbi:MAG: SUMF1/EgtB/PvdO family nonheme iron enzyme [Kiritimatiellae bacterium]|nr:SUMF1/EgtB/PvdO family nonheme iron enzyme [Kiritimatiellia bacterium]
MNRINVAMFAVAVVATVHAATVDQVIVRQQWPWSETIKVEYVLSDVSAPVNISVAATADGAAVDAANMRASLSGDVYGVTKNGACTLEIDPAVALGASRASVRRFQVRLTTSAAPAGITNELYRIFDLNDGSCESVSRADIMSRPDKYGSYETDFSKIGDGFNTTLDPSEVFIWTGVTNNPIYKTDKLVMRRIYAKDKVWQGSVNTGNATKEEFSQYWVKLTNDYLIAVFETTQAQWTKIYWVNYSNFASAEDADYRPVENVAQMEVIGGPADSATLHGTWRQYYTFIGNEIYGFPTNSYLHDIDKNTFMKKMWDKTGYEFFLPTEAQWEYACRAGTTTSYNHGIPGNIAAISTLVAWNSYNSEDETHVVGTKPCNAFGLYDMHGNVMEMTAAAGTIASNRDGHGDTEDDPILEPLGAASTFSYVKRGGGYLLIQGVPYWGTSSTWRNAGYSYLQFRDDMGFRLVCPVNRQWEAH